MAQVVHTSSSAIFGIPEHNPVTEDTPGRPLEAYGRAKLTAETLCREAVQAGLDVSIVRPRTILGHGRLGIMAILFEFVAEGAPVFVLIESYEWFLAHRRELDTTRRVAPPVPRPPGPAPRPQAPPLTTPAHPSSGTSRPPRALRAVRHASYALPPMLWFERQLVATMVSHLGHDERARVSSYVEGSLGAMPEHIRLGVGAESVVLGAWARLPGRLGGALRDGTGVSLRALETNPLNPVRQYARLMRSLVLFAEHELQPGAGG